MRKREYTPIVFPNGEVVHATSLLEPKETACGKKTRRCRVALRKLDCIDCKAAVFYPVKRKGKKR